MARLAGCLAACLWLLAAAHVNHAAGHLAEAMLQKNSTNSGGTSFKEDGLPSKRLNELRKACGDTRRVENAVLADAETHQTQKLPVFLALYGGIANGKSTSIDPTLQHLKVNRSTFIETGKDEIMMKIPEYKTFINDAKDKGGLAAKEDGLAALDACRTVSNLVQPPLLDFAVDEYKNFMIEWTNPENAQKLARGELSWVNGLANYDIVFVLVMVVDIKSVLEAEDRRGKATGRVLPQRVTLKYNQDMEFHYLNAVRNMINNGVGRSRRFFVQQRCTATDPGTVVEVTDKLIDMLASLPGAGVVDSKTAEGMVQSVLGDDAPACKNALSINDVLRSMGAEGDFDDNEFVEQFVKNAGFV